MKSLLASLLIILAFSSCKKDTNGCGTPNNSSPDYFEFGYSGGIAGIHKTFIIKGGYLYPTDTLHAPLSAAKLATAQTLINTFPNYLHLYPDSSFGCRGCADEMVVDIKIKDNGVIRTWHLDTDTATLPQPLRAYTLQAYSIIDNL